MAYPSPTYKAAYAASQAALAKAEKSRDGWKEQAGLFKDERNGARLDLATARLELGTARSRIAELEAATPVDCTKAVADARKSAFLEASAVAHEALAKLS